ncbi:hypothetical protein BO82DRAFT_341559 [Aspergillus uvarum CBS 121591]|uniref:Uncharacterized protein n=1 Tax=Aspergillus uvarum CBS 121591 TaxID=1448315 RepID=A0A319DGX1_9EURO|nr:hypothetical protein BO82DRAFT_341559 [Aspergillus uvarum CBS 121591]PYH78922.1 hypothetical protein BO82DRAFT_341559 [Aspergillus uvarum CBS 121591]
MDAAALLCNICPKRPTFSDVSHLLTHVASKAHLSHYFKLQVRSHQEQQAVDLLDEYDRWYKTNNLGRLLSDRMSSKEARKKKTSTKPTTHAEVKVEKTDAPISVLPLIHHPFPDYLDPRLADTYIERPLELSHAGSSSVGSECELWKREPRDAIAYDDGFSVMPYWASPREDRMATGTNTIDRGYSSDPFLDEGDSIDCPVSGLLDKERADEMARLKGILWPGMDIFDSATEQMRRRRNQKKDESILRMMEKTSLCVEPTELVFSPTGILRKQRVISGNVEDSSPLKGETPIPKRRVSRSKRVLSQLDANINRRQHGPNKKRNKKIERQSVECMAEHSTQSAAQSRQGQVSVYRRSCADDQAKSVPKRRSGLKDRNEFAVYRDEEGQHRRSSWTQHTNGGLSYAASAVAHPILLLREYTARIDECASHSATHLSAFTERTPDESMDKENIEPLFNACGRIDPGVDWRSPAMKQHLANDIGYPPQIFYQNAQSAGLSPFRGHDSPAGYHYNPLSVSLGRLPVEETQLSTLNSQAGANYKARAESPEGTVSDAEEGEFDRLYLPGSSC